MTTSDLFELYTLKNGQWQLDCVFNEKEDANHEAWRIFNTDHFDGVKVIHETFDETTNKAKATVVFNRSKDDAKKPVKSESSSSKSAPKRSSPSAPAKMMGASKPFTSEKKASFIHNMGLRIIAVCAILLGVVAVGFFLVDRF